MEDGHGRGADGRDRIRRRTVLRRRPTDRGVANVVGIVLTLSRITVGISSAAGMTRAAARRSSTPEFRDAPVRRSASGPGERAGARRSARVRAACRAPTLMLPPGTGRRLEPGLLLGRISPDSAASASSSELIRSPELGDRLRRGRRSCARGSVFFGWARGSSKTLLPAARASVMCGSNELVEGARERAAHAGVPRPGTVGGVLDPPDGSRSDLPPEPRRPRSLICAGVRVSPPPAASKLDPMARRAVERAVIVAGRVSGL